MARHGWPRRLLALLLDLFLLLVLLVVALLDIAIFGANLPPVRRFVAERTTSLLSSTFKGSLAIESVGSIGLTGASGVHVRVRDADGRQVLFASGVSTRFAPMALLRSLMTGDVLTITLPRASIDYLDASLDSGENGELRLMHAISSRTPERKETEPSRGVRFSIGSFAMSTGWIHGRPGQTPPVDTDVLSLSGRVNVQPGHTSLHIDHAEIGTRGLPRGADVKGKVAVHVEIPSKGTGSPEGSARFEGDIAGAPIVILTSLQRRHLTARADATLGLESSRILLPETALKEPVVLAASVDGILPILETKARVVAGRASVSLEGKLRMGSPARATVRVDARHVDLAAVLPKGPSSDLAATAEASATLPSKGYAQGVFEIRTARGRVRDVWLPPATARGRIGNNKIDATVSVHEPRAPTELALTVRSTPAGVVGEFALASVVRDFRDVPWAGKIAEGRGRIEAKGTVDLGERTVKASADAETWDLLKSGARVGHATIAADVVGSLVNPSVRMTGRATDLSFWKFAFSDAQVSAEGRLKSANVAATMRGPPGRFSTRATLDLDDGISVHEPVIAARRNGIAVTITASEATTRSGTIWVKDANVTGLGAPLRSEFLRNASALRVRASAPRIDLDRVSRFLGTKKRARGQVSLDVEVTGRRDNANGHVDVTIEKGEIPRVGLVEGELRAKIDRRRLDGALDARVGPGHLGVVVDQLELAGPLDRGRSWRNAVGIADIDADVNLAHLDEILPTGALPFTGLEGALVAKGRLHRTRPHTVPAGSLYVKTQGMSVAARGKPQRPFAGLEVEGPPRTKVNDVDVELQVSIGEEGRTDASGRLLDRAGTLIAVSGDATIPYAALVRNPAAALELLRTVPFRARARVPRRNLGGLPPALRTRSMQGFVDVVATAEDTLLRPRVDVQGSIEQFAIRGRTQAKPIDVHLSAQYDGAEGLIELRAASQDAELLHVDSQVELAMADVLEERPMGAPWRAQVRAKAVRFPLESVPPLQDFRLSGALSGDMSASAGSQEPPRVTLRLETTDMKIGRALRSSGLANLSVNESELSFDLKMSHSDGSLEGSARLPLRWSTPTKPSIDHARSARASVKAHGFRAEILQPFIQESVKDLEGSVDADLHLENGARGPALVGTAAINRGRFQLPGIGQEFHDAKASLAFRRDGVIEAQRVSARGLSGKIEANGEGRMNGLEFLSARGTVRIGDGDPLPITIEGQALAEGWGKAHVNAVNDTRTGQLQLTVDVPRATVRLPRKSSHALQRLEPSDHIRVGVQRTPDRFVVLPLAAPEKDSSDKTQTSVTTTVHLHDIKVTRGTDLRVRLEGNPVVTSGEETKITGNIVLRGGFLEVQGKRFEIEHGTLAFVGEPDNPEVVVTAGWTAPEGTRIFADFIGPLKTGKVTLRSEPAHTRSEILALILFGSANGAPFAQEAKSPGGGQSAAIGVAGGFATQGLNRAIDDLTGLDVTTRIDTSESANPRPEVEVQIARDISLSLAHVLGVPPPGTNPDRNLAILNWRVGRNWSVETTFGDQGSSTLDVVWQYRY